MTNSGRIEKGVSQHETETMQTISHQFLERHAISVMSRIEKCKHDFSKGNICRCRTRRIPRISKPVALLVVMLFASTSFAQSYSFADSLVKYWSDYKAVVEADISQPILTVNAFILDTNGRFSLAKFDTVGYHRQPATWDGFMDYLTTKGFDKPTTKNPPRREP